MRAVLFIVIIAVLVILAALATGFLDINQVRGAKVPAVSATRNGVTAKGGQAPAFEVETGSVQVGTRDRTLKVPDVRVNPPAGNAAANQADTVPANKS
jgi:hypothetical protein